ncbi:L-asparaginase [Granulibacter bethesdensis]|uniref:L-asparaginase n=3 Tax=Granulibacter bethesdensis TaxID=364410 RepID=Q0BV40_GRABC|nr:L-asparaginase [Granulibacter bethesdensis CGDNIH1]AHJ62182.1 L-asparaginase [Granulibacter bethesdensis]AHJ64807.1 L-asparaginase [Granulibacter bethesdensis CGDNIH4]AHJ67426.1 L-asparaginase [Granulibacter bethesdensis]APH51099.1 L-asparaginase [Granulibacter bethesdensis]
MEPVMRSGPLSVLIVSTGGTISKRYVEATGALDPHPDWLAALGPRLRLPQTEITMVQPVLKDSLDFTDADRDAVADAVFGAESRFGGILVTHGTDTVRETMRHLEARVAAGKAVLTRPVVFTGAMAPLHIDGSDAVQNLSAALTALRLLPPGLHLAFHDQVLSGTQFEKDRTIGTFRQL